MASLRGSLITFFLSVWLPSLLIQNASAQSSNCAATTDKTVNICSPASGPGLFSPVQFTAAALDNEHPVTFMALYVDSQQRASSTNAGLSASIPLAPGTHAVVIRAWD